MFQSLTNLRDSLMCNSIKKSYSGKLFLVVILLKGGVTMPNQDDTHATKAEVQSTELNKIPVPGQDDTEFSAEEAAEAFKENQTSSSRSQNQ